MWNPYNNTFYWVDIIDKKIKSLDNDIVLEYPVDKMPTCITLIDKNNITLVLEDSIGIYDFRNNSFNKMIDIDASKVRFNDDKLDNNGILHIGTMDRNEKDYIGSIYKYDNGYLEEIISNIGISNGIAFSKNNTMYYSDSLSGKIFTKKDVNRLIYEYDNLSPDGGTVKNEKYYSCLWGGSRIDIFENFMLTDSINLPVKYPTCCCFGGMDNEKLFITSASILDKSGDNGKIIIL